MQRFTQHTRAQLQARRQPAADDIGVYTADPSLPLRDREVLQEELDQVDTDPNLQSLCREIVANQTLYLSEVETRDRGTGLEAKRTIPEGVAIALYSGLIRRAEAQLDRHNLSLGAQILKYQLKIDSSRVAGGPQTGRMQLANHACLHSALLHLTNCLSVDVPSSQSCLGFFLLRTSRIIQINKQLTFAYQTRVTSTSFWQTEQKPGASSAGQGSQRA